MPDVDHRELLEMALRPLGALGPAAEFPQDRAGIEALIARLAAGRPSEQPKRFAYEDGKALPRYDGEHTTWLSPGGDGALRVRREHLWDLSSVAVVLLPDGRVGAFEEIDGFGVPDSELTDQARADREAHERRAREREEREPEHEQWLEESQARFRTENLIRTVAAAPDQDPDGPVVAYVALYNTGVMVNYLVPRPPEEVLHPEDPDDPFAEPHMEAMFPSMEIDDGLGTEYKVVEIDSVDSNSSPLRARLSFAPAIPGHGDRPPRRPRVDDRRDRPRGPMSPPGIEDFDHGPQEAASILLLQVALRLLGEARLRGDFGDEADLAERAAAIAAELTGGAPSPDPQRELVEVDLIRPDRIGLAAPFREGGTSTWSLMLDGTLYEGGGVSSVGYAAIDPEELSPEELAEVERQRAEWQAELDRQQRFTATRFVRAVPAPPQTATATRVLATLLYEDGFYVEITYDKEPPSLDLEMDAERFFALAHEGKPEVTVEDDLGTEYFESGGGGWGGGIRVSHSSFGFAPAPPPSARLLRVTGESVEFDLPPQPRTEARHPSDTG